MAKKVKVNVERYEYIRAIVDGADLRWEYKLASVAVAGHMDHDEDVSDWSKSDIENLTVSMLDVTSDDRSKIEVLYA